MEEIEQVSDADVSVIREYLNKLGDWAVNKAFELLLAVVCMYIGMKLSKLIVKLIGRSFQKSHLEDSVASFLLSLIKFALYAVVFIAAASIVGFQVTSLVTILGTASLAIGLALQGSLANFAGGVLILILKPFRVGDYIIENDKKCEGTVVSIDIFYTKLRTYDNQIVVIPNGNITSNSLINVTAEGERRLDIAVGVAYDSDLKLVREVLNRVVSGNAYCDRSKEIEVFVDSFSDSSIRMGVRCTVAADAYWKAKWEIQEQIKTAFDEAGIVIPYNRLEVTVEQER